MVKTARNRGMDFRYLDSSLFVNKDQVSVHRRNNTNLDYINMKDLILSRLKREGLCSGWSGNLLDESFDILIPKSAFVTRPQRNGLNRNIDLYAIINTLGEASDVCNNSIDFSTRVSYTLDFVNNLHLSLKVDPTNNSRFFVDTGIVDTETVSLLSIIDKSISNLTLDFSPTYDFNIDYSDPDNVSVKFVMYDRYGNVIGDVGDNRISLTVNGFEQPGAKWGDTLLPGFVDALDNFLALTNVTGTVDDFSLNKNPLADPTKRFTINIYYKWTYYAPDGSRHTGTSETKAIPVLDGATR